MSSAITIETLRHLADLARIELKSEEEEKLLKDLQKILDHFEELKTLDTSHVHPMSGGTHLKNIFREDGASRGTNLGQGVELFPVEEEGFLKTLPVFGE